MQTHTACFRLPTSFDPRAGPDAADADRVAATIWRPAALHLQGNLWCISSRLLTVNMLCDPGARRAQILMREQSNY